MVRTARVVVRRTTRTSPSSTSLVVASGPTGRRPALDFDARAMVTPGTDQANDHACAAHYEEPARGPECVLEVRRRGEDPEQKQTDEAAQEQTKPRLETGTERGRS